MAVNSVRHGFLCNNTSYNEFSSTSTHMLCMRVANPLLSLRISAGSLDPLMLSIAINQNLTMLALFYELFISCIY